MPYVLVHQSTADFGQWKHVFDAAAPMRAAAGCTDTLVLRDQDDPDRLVVLLEFEDLDPAMRYMEDPQLRQAWEQAAVTGRTEVELLVRTEE